MVRVWHPGVLSVAFAATAAGGAVAQTMNTTTTSFNAGWGRSAGQENRPVEYSTRDSNANQIVVNGVIGGGSASSSQSGSGSQTTLNGTLNNGFGSASAIGNNLVVITNGDHNTVVVSANQINNGAITASTNVKNASAPATAGGGS